MDQRLGVFSNDESYKLKGLNELRGYLIFSFLILTLNSSFFLSLVKLYTPRDNLYNDNHIKLTFTLPSRVSKT